VSVSCLRVLASEKDRSVQRGGHLEVDPKRRRGKLAHTERKTRKRQPRCPTRRPLDKPPTRPHQHSAGTIKGERGSERYPLISLASLPSLLWMPWNNRKMLARTRASIDSGRRSHESALTLF
jgi:hypothetical protein